MSFRSCGIRDLRRLGYRGRDSWLLRARLRLLTSAGIRNVDLPRDRRFETPIPPSLAILALQRVDVQDDVLEEAKVRAGAAGLIRDDDTFLIVMRRNSC